MSMEPPHLKGHFHNSNNILKANNINMNPDLIPNLSLTMLRILHEWMSIHHRPNECTRFPQELRGKIFLSSSVRPKASRVHSTHQIDESQDDERKHPS